jgi:hypothetical protein
VLHCHLATELTTMAITNRSISLHDAVLWQLGRSKRPPYWRHGATTEIAFNGPLRMTASARGLSFGCADPLAGLGGHLRLLPFSNISS